MSDDDRHFDLALARGLLELLAHLPLFPLPPVALERRRVGKKQTGVVRKNKLWDNGRRGVRRGGRGPGGKRRRPAPAQAGPACLPSMATSAEKILRDASTTMD